MCLSFFRANRAQHCHHFALLDLQGRCIAFKSCEGIPRNGEWVQVNEVNLAWLNRTLPARAVVRSHTLPI